MSSDNIVEARGISKSYAIRHTDLRPTSLKEALSARSLGTRRGRTVTERFQALDDVSFDVRSGERLGIIGANGAGKSTLLKVLCQVTLPDAGTIGVRGTIGSLLEVGTGFHPDLTGRENVFLNGAILGLTRREIVRRFDEIVAFAGVERFLDTPVKRYSSGMHVRLGFAVAAHLEPDILIVDEVLAVGDAAFQRKCIGKLDEVATNDGRTVIFVSHSQAAVQELCSRVILMEGGKIAFDGPMKEGMLRYLDIQDAEATVSGTWDLSTRTNGRDPALGPVMSRLAILSNGAQTADVTTGSPVELRVTIPRLPDCAEPWIGVRLTSELGQPLSTFISPLAAEGAAGPDAAVCAVLSVPELPFAPGNYRIDVGVVDVASGRVLDEVRSAGVLSLRHPELAVAEYLTRFGDGMVAVPAVWRVEADGTSAQAQRRPKER
jgi:lipopolysaccharide transport system ATP-binding protein